MSGRNMRNFITSHRSDEAGKLVMRVKDGIHSNKYREADYDTLRSLAAKKKSEGASMAAKFNKFKQVSKQSKENSILRKHKQAWQGSWSRLLHSLANCEGEANESMTNMLSSETVQDDAQLLMHENSELLRQHSQFSSNTVTPVNDLIDDLKLWLRDHHTQSIASDRSDVVDIMSTVESVRSQQEKLLEQLVNEQCDLEIELGKDDLLDLVSPSNPGQLTTGIPIEAFNLYCPDDNLKASLLQQFILLDDSYMERLDALYKSHADAVADDTGGWLVSDHDVFVTAMSVYNSKISGYRMLCLDYLKRHLPEKTRQELVAHEDWWHQLQFYKKRRKDLLADWTRDRGELLNRVAVTFNEACLLDELQAAKQQYREQQQQICTDLFSKVEEWRHYKLEAQQLQHNLAARHAEHMRWVEEQEAKKQQAAREKTKKQISEYHEKQVEEKRKKDEADQKRLDALKELLAEQAVYDLQRVEYRDELQRVREEERKMKEKQKEEELFAREAALEKLREKVRPQVEADMLRVISDTEAWKHHQQGEEDIDIQRPLYEVNTFTSKQITSDPRYRLEQKLREAGLHNTDYGRKIVSKFPAARPPRRDMESTVFKQ